VGEFTLTDDDHGDRAKLSPNIFLRLAQLQGPLAPLFPNLRRLRIVKADYSLDYLHLFLSPSLETLEIVGLGEAYRATLLSFLSAAVVEVPNLNTLILGSGQLSRDVVNTCLSFNRLKHLELVNAVSEADYQLLKDIGGLEQLETFVIDAQDVEYTPSQAEEDELARVVTEEELRRQQVEEEEQERRRKATLPRVMGVCWVCEKRIKKPITECQSCTLKIIEQEKYMRELDEEERKCKKAEEEQEQKICEEAVAEYERCQEWGDIYGSQVEDQESTEENDERRDNTDGSETSADAYIRSLAKASMEESLPPKFPNLLNITVRGSAELMQDVVELITSASVVLLCLDMAPMPQSSLSPSIKTPPSRRFVDTLNFALRRWVGTIAHVTLSRLPSVASKLPDKTFRTLIHLPRLEHLEINGWNGASDMTDEICRHTGVNTLKLKVLHLPNDSNAIIVPLSKLWSIAEACPDLLSLRCCLDNHLDILNQSVSGSNPFPHSLETLTVGNTSSLLDFDAVLEVARYIDNLFPNIKSIKPFEGTDQSAEQWRHIDKLVKFRQSGWLDRIRS